MNEGTISPQAQRLLNLSQTLNYYERVLAHPTGQQFNLFNVIGSCEETHSRLLAELLNPKGSHGQGAVFLEHFIKVVKSGKSVEITDYGNVKVEREVCIPSVTDGDGGRIDILIREGNDPRIIIENKIYADEQKYQLNRYEDFARDAAIIFLTLYEHQPQNLRDGKKPTHLICISYKEHILGWLKACQREAVAAPLVREAIAQYIGLIRKITNQTTSDDMSQEIINAVLSGKDTLKAYFTLVENKDAVIKEVLKKLEAQCKEIGAEFGLQVHFTSSESNPHEISHKYGGFYFVDEEMKKRNLSILFQFDRNDFRSLGFGIARLVEDKNAARTPITDRFESIFGECSFGSWWPARKPWRGREDWNDETFCDIFCEDFKEELWEKVEKLAKIVRETNV
jgi:hypothetical protein